MTDDQSLRAALAAIILLVLPVGIYHRARSQSSGERLDRRQEGWFILATLRPLGLVLWLGVVAYLVDPSWIAWAAAPLPAWLRWTGIGVCAAADVLMIWTFRRLGRNLTDTVVTRRDHTLVTDGPYRWVRHPFYLSAGLFIGGVSLVAANWFFLLVGVAVMGLLMVRTRTEEEKLLARFGETYRAYVERTGRFLPRGGPW